jgi:hypothetical protein
MPGGHAPEQTADNSFPILVINNTPFDIELVDDTRVVPARSERTVSLPRYRGELNDGYSLTYRVNLLDGVYIRVPRDEHIIVAPEQGTLVIEKAEFMFPETFVVLRNRSARTVRVREGAVRYRRGLKEAGRKRHYGSADIAAGGSALFDGIDTRTTLEVESDNYQPIPFPIDDFKQGFRYIFVFDGAEVTLADARPLFAIGQPLAAAVEFDDGVTETEQAALLKALNDGLAANNAAVRVLPGLPGEEVFTETGGEKDVVFFIAMTHGSSPAVPPLNRELRTGEVTVTLSRAGRILAEHRAAVADFDEDGVYRTLRRLFAGDTRLHQKIAEGMKDFR